MSLVVNPYSYFTDTNGNALNGYLYVGEVGKNAENYPIAIFYDNLFTTPAPNPLTISAGYIYNGGTIAQIYASVDYSIVVKKTDGSLVYSSLNETGMTNGAIANIDEMKDFVAPYDNYALNVLGYSEAGDGGGGVFYYDVNSTEDDNGGTIIEPTSGSGRWIRQYSGAVNVKWFGAKGDGVTDDTDSIKTMIASGINNIHFPNGTYLISEPLHFTYRVFITADKAIIKADSGFTGKVFTDSGNSTTITLYGCIININGNYNDIGGSRAENSYISGIDFQCEDVADGIIVERFMDTIVENCNIYKAKNYGIINSVYTWGSRFKNIRIEGFVTAGIYLGEASNGIDISGVVIWGYPVRGVYGIQSQGNNNGVSIKGSIIERVDYGIYLGARFGPFSIAGVDFEDTTYNNIYANCPDYAENRLAGPINITGCYLDSGNENINNNIALVKADNCRFRASPHFNADSTYGVNISENNQFDGLLPVVTAGRFRSDTNVSQNIQKKTYHFNTSVDYNGNIDEYYLSSDQRTVKNAHINFKSSNQGGASSLHTSKVEIAAISSAYTDTTYSTTEIVVNNIGSNMSLSPSSDNSIALGQSGTRWSVVYAATGTINTSDDREKTYLNIEDAEKQVALDLKANIKKFKFNDAIDIKGIDKARIHFGASAQTVKSIFEKYGLNAFDYALLCNDVWYEDTDGNIIDYIDGIELPENAIKKDRYGIRYEELLCFIIGAL